MNLGSLLTWAFVFTLGFVVGSLLSWWVTLYWECPRRYQQKPEEGEKPYEVALRLPEAQNLEVFYQGRWYQDARQLVPEAFQHLQRLSFRLLHWLDQAEKPRYAQASQAAQRGQSRGTQATSSALPGLDRMPEEVDRRVQEKAKAQGIQVPIRITAQGSTILIWVGNTRYERLADIPDPKIRALIREAVREWEEEWRREWQQRQQLSP